MKKEHKLSNSTYDKEGEMMVHQQIMDSYNAGTSEMLQQTETEQVENQKK